MPSLTASVLLSLALSLAAGCGAPLPGESFDEGAGSHSTDTARPIAAVTQSLSIDSLIVFKEFPCSAPVSCGGWSVFVDSGVSQCVDSWECSEEYDCKRCRVACNPRSQNLLGCWGWCCSEREGPQTQWQQIQFRWCTDADGRTCRDDKERWLDRCGC